MRRPPLSLGDRIEAFGKLRPADAATSAALADILRPREPQGALKSAARRAAIQTASPSPGAVSDTLLRQKPDAGTDIPLANDATSNAVIPPMGTTKVTPLERRPFVPPPASATPQLDSSSGVKQPRDPPPLIGLNQTRAILATLVARPHEGIAIDVAALLRRIVSGMPLKSLPRREVWSLRRGAQLLVDCSPAMTPISKDVEAIERRLVSILGRDRLKHLYFAGCPSRDAGPGERSTWKAWKPSNAGTPVIALTDLGCAGSMSNDEWVGAEEWGRFADYARGAGSAIIALLPFPVHRVPPVLARKITIVPWNEALSAARVRRILNDSRGHVHT